MPLDRAGTIEVRVTGSDGRTPIAGAQVAVRSERGMDWWEGYRPPPAPVSPAWTPASASTFE